jgi:hypothetical protein
LVIGLLRVSSLSWCSPASPCHRRERIKTAA